MHLEDLLEDSWLVDGFDRLDDAGGLAGFAADDLFAEGEGEEFLRVLRVITAGRSQVGRPAYRVSPTNLRQPAARRQLLGTDAGVFLQGASAQQARRWAQQQAQRMGGTVTRVERHGTGRPHYHIEGPGFRTGHIFFGRRPRGRFFDEAY
jgi:hypothetical protein